MADVTDLHEFQGSSYDVAIDNQCLHMLITDEHRKKYLFEVKRLLKKNGIVFFRESYRPKKFGFKEQISSLQEFIDTYHDEYTKLHDYTAYADHKLRKVKLPKIPARANSEQGYRKELREAGFSIEYFKNSKYQCIFYAGIIQ